MLSWKSISLLAAAAIAMNGVVGVEEGGVWATAPPTTALDDSPVESLAPATTPTTPSSTDNSESTDSDYDNDSLASDAGSVVDGSSAIDEGSDSQPSEHPPSANGDGSCEDLPHRPSSSGSIDFPPFPGSGSTSFPPLPSGSGSTTFPTPPSDVDSGSAPSGDGPVPSSVDGSDRDSSTLDDSTAGEASTSGDDDHTPQSGGCKVRSRRLRQ
ncbi:hypothetical protein F444_07292 [Phytophthora nicotianae P1976]|uniref:RxLR effector protein n=1 Tax=Phytophthora nicotianae P1976 TaxID=1317066 RepID=A0A081AF59_PHYNI|nr:hypothetical protein F444_07292 [Phytophthora nicotianae P1976]